MSEIHPVPKFTSLAGSLLLDTKYPRSGRLRTILGSCGMKTPKWASVCIPLTLGLELLMTEDSA